MADLRQILSQGRKRIGILVGAGAPTAIQVDDDNQIVQDGKPLVPDVSGLTDTVVCSLALEDQDVVEKIKAEIEEAGDLINIETILTRIRRLGQVIGSSTIHGLDGVGYADIGGRICQEIGKKVNVSLPDSPNPYTELVSWIAGTQREHSVEIFTPNYDLLIEEAFERERVPYFDGFVGAHRPFFDPASVSSDELPARWSRLWKLHGSLGWSIFSNSVVRSGQREATELIYPDHLKYDQVTRLPYSALFERLREFLMTPDTLLVCSGFSFLDSHICAVLEETLAANTHTAILALQYRVLSEEEPVTKIARFRPNMSVYARDGAVINGIAGSWRPGQPINQEWEDIRGTFWRPESEGQIGQFLLGDFAQLARFLALTQAQQLESPESGQDEQGAGTGTQPDPSIKVDA